MKRNSILILLAIAGLAVSSKAASVLSDDFNYPDGAIVGASGSPWGYVSGTAGSMLATNSSLEVNGGRSEDINATLSGGPYLSGGPVAALYSKFTVRFIALPSGAGTYFAHFTGPNITTDFRARILACTTNVTTLGNAAAGNFYLGIANNSGTVGLSVPFPTELTTNVTYTVVTKYVLSTGLSTLWIDPVDESSPSVTATLSPSTANIVYYAFRQGAAAQGAVRVDSLRVGTAFSDVAGANTAPSISSIPNVSVPRNVGSGVLPFVVGDAESTAASLTVSKASTNETLIPLSGVVVNDGDGTNRTVTVTPATGQQGQSLITLTVSDGPNIANSSFLVTVGAPSISVVPNQIAAVNAVIPSVAFTVSDPEGDTLSQSVVSSNTNILKSANITINGTGSSRTLTLVPEANTNGFTTITLSFSDGFTTTTRSFALSITPALGVLLQDQFAYTSFLLPNALYQATDSPWLTASGTAYELQSTNGWAYINPALSEDLGAPLTNTSGTFPNFTAYASSEGVVFYSSFTLKATSLPKFAGDYFAHLKNSYNGTTFRAKVFTSTNGAAANSFRIGIANQANAGTYLPVDCSLNTDYLVVTRYNSAIGEATLWVNPTSEASASIVGADALQTTPIGGYGLRQTGGTSTVGDTGDLQISNLVVSTSFPALPVTAPINITGISVVSSTVTVAFTAGAGDSIGSFSLLSSSTVDGTYTAAGAVITSPSAGTFEASVATSGNAQFYRIKRN
ncbi:MAG: hypothetical protein QM813_12675 [Verrucomicrobiota bacterium]